MPIKIVALFDYPLGRDNSLLLTSSFFKFLYLCYFST